MRYVGVLLIALAFTSPAVAKPDPQVTALKKEVTALRQQVQSLTNQMTLLRAINECHFAQHEDSFRTVFGALNQFAKYLTGSTVPAWDAYLALPKHDDKGACATAGLPRP